MDIFEILRHLAFMIKLDQHVMPDWVISKKDILSLDLFVVFKKKNPDLQSIWTLFKVYYPFHVWNIQHFWRIELFRVLELLAFYRERPSI